MTEPMQRETRYEKAYEHEIPDIEPTAQVLVNVYAHSPGRVLYEVLSKGADLTDEEVKRVLAGAFMAISEGSVTPTPSDS